jgi:hypothetical protein
VNVVLLLHFRQFKWTVFSSVIERCKVTTKLKLNLIFMKFLFDTPLSNGNQNYCQLNTMDRFFSGKKQSSSIS